MGLLNDLQKAWAYKASPPGFKDWIDMVSKLLESESQNEGPPFFARNVVTANVANLLLFPVATATDGVTNVAGDIVFLAAQTNTYEGGPYVVGTVTAGIAPLTRPFWWRTGMIFPCGTRVTIGNEGTVFGGTRWYTTVIGVKTFTVGGVVTTLQIPEFFTREVTLVAGTATLTPIPLAGANKRQIAITRVLENTTSLTVQYSTPAAGMTSGGLSQPGSLVVRADVAAGTINVADISTLEICVHNQG